MAVLGTTDTFNVAAVVGPEDILSTTGTHGAETTLGSTVTIDIATTSILDTAAILYATPALGTTTIGLAVALPLPCSVLVRC